MPKNSTPDVSEWVISNATPRLLMDKATRDNPETDPTSNAITVSGVITKNGKRLDGSVHNVTLAHTRQADFSFVYDESKHVVTIRRSEQARGRSKSAATPADALADFLA